MVYLAEKSRNHPHVEQPRINETDNGVGSKPSYDAGINEITGQGHEQSGGKLLMIDYNPNL